MKILVVGNCQARPVAQILELLCAGDTPASGAGPEFLEPVIVHLARAADLDEHEQRYREADFIVAQQVADNYPTEHVTTRYFRDRFPEKLVSWINVFFHGQNPDLFYITGDDGRKLYGPLDVYHSRALFESWKRGSPAGDVEPDSYLSSMCTADDLSERAETSLRQLQRKEADADIVMSDFIEANWKRAKLFHTFNHPALPTLIELCHRMRARLFDLQADRETVSVKDPLTLIIPPFEAGMANELGFEFQVPAEFHGVSVAEDHSSVTVSKRVSYGFADLVDSAFRCYDAQKDVTENVKYTPL